MILVPSDTKHDTTLFFFPIPTEKQNKNRTQVKYFEVCLEFLVHLTNFFSSEYFIVLWKNFNLLISGLSGTW